MRRRKGKWGTFRVLPCRQLFSPSLQLQQQAEQKDAGKCLSSSLPLQQANEITLNAGAGKAGRQAVLVKSSEDWRNRSLKSAKGEEKHNLFNGGRKNLLQ